MQLPYSIKVLEKTNKRLNQTYEFNASLIVKAKKENEEITELYEENKKFLKFMKAKYGIK